MTIGAMELLKDVKNLSESELKLFNELYQEFIAQQEWQKLAEQTLEWDDEKDDYSDVFSR